LYHKSLPQIVFADVGLEYWKHVRLLSHQEQEDELVQNEQFFLSKQLIFLESSPNEEGKLNTSCEKSVFSSFRLSKTGFGFGHSLTVESFGQRLEDVHCDTTPSEHQEQSSFPRQSLQFGVS